MRCRIASVMATLSAAMFSCVVAAGPAVAAETVVRVTCHPDNAKVATPVVIGLEGVDAGKNLPAGVIMVEEGTAKRVAGQVITGPGRSLCFIMPPREMGGGVRTFRITEDRPGPAGLTVSDKDPDRLVVSELGKPVLAFVRNPILKKGVPGRYRRMGYLHPVYDLDGTVLTDDFPRDHFHHRGVSWAWPRVTYAGHLYDMWHIADIKRRLRKVLSTEAGPVCAVLRINNEWAIEDHPTGDAKDRGYQKPPVVDEKVELCVWSADKTARIVDVFLTLTALKGPVSIGGRHTQSKGYGGFNCRFAPRKETVLFGPNGRQPDVVNKVPMAWSDLSAKFDSGNPRVSGMAMFDSPSNPGFPSGWSNRTYGYLNPAWPGLDKYVLEPGKPLRLRYRVYIHRGDVVAGKVVFAQRSFVHPPSGTIVTAP